MSSSEFFSKSEFSFTDTFTDIRLVYSSEAGHTELYSAKKALKRFALKALKSELRDDPFYIGMLRKEFEIGFRLEHPSIIRTYSFEEVNGLGPCIILEWVDGETMATYIENQKLNEKTWRKAVAELCDALEYLEKHQIVHRDIKPSNVMLTSDGYHVKLIDFGFADSPEYGTLKVNGGTRDYAAPELLSHSWITSSADIYATGKILEALPVKKNRKYRNLVSRMTSEHSAARPQSVEKVKAEWNKVPGGNRRNKYLILAALAVFAGGIVGLIAPRTSEKITPVQTDKNNDEIVLKEEGLDSLVQEETAVEGVKPKNISSLPSEERVETIPGTTKNTPVAGKTKRVVHWMVLLTSQSTLGTAKKLIESGDSLWELHTRQKMEEWVDSQTEGFPEIKEACHEEITIAIETLKMENK